MALLWKDDVCLNILSYSFHHIHGSMTLVSTESNCVCECMVTGVYGHPYLANQSDVWNLLCNLGSTVDKLWLVFSDFNKIIHCFEKWGGRVRPEKQMNDFCEVLATSEQRDLGYEGSPFTWCNNREGEGRIFKRLDRFLANYT